MSASEQAPLRFSFLGPAGTFTYAALRQVASPDSVEIPALDVPMALRLVRSGEADYAVVPIENSVEGGVNATLDALTDGSALQIKAEMLVPIAFSLAVRPGTRREDIRAISTHSHAWAQCRGWIAERLGAVVHVPATSTAAGAKTLAESDNPGFEAALCPPATVELMGLESLSDDVADKPGAVTRFIPHDEAGALLSMLEQFSARGINLSRIESRPIGDSLGRYAFSIDAEGHLCDERIQAVLIGLHRVCPQIVFLGSYPSASGERIRPRPGTSDADFRAGREFVERLLDGRA